MFVVLITPTICNILLFFIIEGVIYADNLDKALVGLNKEYPLEYRWKPYEKENIDSLAYDILEVEYIIEDID